MKNLLVLCVIAVSAAANAQNPLSQSTQVEIGLGYARPFLNSGKELTRAQQLRDNGQSYFENSEGNRKNVGKYPGLSGYAFTSNNLFVKGEFGLASVLTKNRFEKSQGEQNFFHHVWHRIYHYCLLLYC